MTEHRVQDLPRTPLVGGVRADDALRRAVVAFLAAYDDDETLEAVGLDDLVAPLRAALADEESGLECCQFACYEDEGCACEGCRTDRPARTDAPEPVTDAMTEPDAERRDVRSGSQRDRLAGLLVELGIVSDVCADIDADTLLERGVRVLDPVSLTAALEAIGACSFGPVGRGGLMAEAEYFDAAATAERLIAALVDGARG